MYVTTCTKNVILCIECLETAIVISNHAEGVSNQKSHPLKAMQKMANMWFLCMVFLITIMHIFLVKAIDCVKDVIMRNR